MNYTCSYEVITKFLLNPISFSVSPNCVNIGFSLRNRTTVTTKNNATFPQRLCHSEFFFYLFKQF